MITGAPDNALGCAYAWVLSYDSATADLSGIGGSDHQTVIDGIVQEIDIRTGRMLFSWNSADHVS